MKKIIFLIVLFLIYTTIICFCPVVTQWDRNIIIMVQDWLKDFPVIIPVLLGKQLYKIGIFVPLIIGIGFFLKKRLYIDAVIFSSIPLVAYILNNYIIKIIIHRPRPPIDLQMIAHKVSFSYVSNHTIVTCSLWGLIIYYLIKYCPNKFIKYIGIAFSVLWIFSVGFSRIWLGLHNPTDVLGGFFLSAILLFIYISMIEKFGASVK